MLSLLMTRNTSTKPETVGWPQNDYHQNDDDGHDDDDDDDDDDDYHDYHDYHDDDDYRDDDDDDDDDDNRPQSNLGTNHPRTYERDDS